MHALVQDYLAVRGYARTLARFDAAVGGEMETMEEGEEGDGRRQLPALVRKRRRGAGGEEGMAARESMRRLVLTEGEEEAALARLGTEHPGVVGKEAAALGFELRCLAFVSRVRRGELDEALAYAQRELGPYVLSVGEQNEEDAMDVCPAADGGGSGREEREALGLAARLREVLGLLAYPGKEREGKDGMASLDLIFLMHTAQTSPPPRPRSRAWPPPRTAPTWLTWSTPRCCRKPLPPRSLLRSRGRMGRRRPQQRRRTGTAQQQRRRKGKGSRTWLGRCWSAFLCSWRWRGRL